MKAPDIFVELFRVFGSRNLRRGVKNIMKGFINYLLPRIIQWFIVIFVGITVAFIIPRLSPVDPVEAVLNKMAGYSIMNPQAVSELRETLEALFGTDKNIFVQYTEFWGRLLKGDLGPSLSMFPVPVIDIIKTSLPWSVFLLLSSTIIAWLLGIFLGTMITVNSKEMGKIVRRASDFFVSNSSLYFGFGAFILVCLLISCFSFNRSIWDRLNT